VERTASPAHTTAGAALSTGTLLAMAMLAMAAIVGLSRRRTHSVPRAQAEAGPAYGALEL
jgi:MYXO-CTERM domain-containing protein